jgi:hypothetical protein
MGFDLLRKSHPGRSIQGREIKDMKPKKLKCPCCNKLQPLTHFGCEMSAKGGRTTGPSKARTTAQASAAGKAGAKKRWANHKKVTK